MMTQVTGRTYNEEYIPMKEEEEPEFTEGEIIEEDTAESEEE